MSERIWKRAAWSRLALGAMAAILLITITPAVTVVHAAGPPVAQATAGEVESDDGGSVDRWWGTAGAILCGLEGRLIRTVPAIGMQPALIAAGLSGCILAVMDIMTTK